MNLNRDKTHKPFRTHLMVAGLPGDQEVPVSCGTADFLDAVAIRGSHRSLLPAHKHPVLPNSMTSTPFSDE